jgi:hydroxymethylpyrimidine/phosphomethylpyrimidine kinase
VVPDRLFWAQPEGDDARELTKEEAQALQVLDMPTNETKH